MAVELSEAMKNGSNGEVIITVEESQGSVQNVMEVIGRKNNYVFTTPCFDKTCKKWKSNV